MIWREKKRQLATSVQICDWRKTEKGFRSHFIKKIRWLSFNWNERGVCWCYGFGFDFISKLSKKRKHKTKIADPYFAPKTIDTHAAATTTDNPSAFIRIHELNIEFKLKMQNQCRKQFMLSQGGFSLIEKKINYSEFLWIEFETLHRFFFCRHFH